MVIPNTDRVKSPNHPDIVYSNSHSYINIIKGIPGKHYLQYFSGDISRGDKNGGVAAPFFYNLLTRFKTRHPFNFVRIALILPPRGYKKQPSNSPTIVTAAIIPMCFKSVFTVVRDVGARKQPRDKDSEDSGGTG